MAVPRAAAARATASSPSGCTACTPVGEQITGSAMSWPRTVVDSSRTAWCPAVRGAKRSSSNASTLSFSVTPFSEPAMSAAYTDGGSRFLARRCATATDSNQGLPMTVLAFRSVDALAPGDDGAQRGSGAVGKASGPDAGAAGDVVGQASNGVPDGIQRRAAPGPADERESEQQRAGGDARATDPPTVAGCQGPVRSGSHSAAGQLGRSQRQTPIRRYDSAGHGAACRAGQEGQDGGYFGRVE